MKAWSRRGCTCLLWFLLWLLIVAMPGHPSSYLHISHELAIKIQHLKWRHWVLIWSLFARTGQCSISRRAELTSDTTSLLKTVWTISTIPTWVANQRTGFLGVCRCKKVGYSCMANLHDQLPQLHMMKANSLSAVDLHM